MDISASRDKDGNFHLEIGIVTFALTEETFNGFFG